MAERDELAVGRWLSLVRKTRNLTQSQLGELVGVNAPYVSEVEKGANITIAGLLRFARALRVSEVQLTDDLVGRIVRLTEFHPFEIEAILNRFHRMGPNERQRWLEVFLTEFNRAEHQREPLGLSKTERLMQQFWISGEMPRSAGAVDTDALRALYSPIDARRGERAEIGLPDDADEAWRVAEQRAFAAWSVKRVRDDDGATSQELAAEWRTYYRMAAYADWRRSRSWPTTPNNVSDIEESSDGES